MRNATIVLLALSVPVLSCSSSSESFSGHAIQVVTAGHDACALQMDGQVFCWGDGSVLLHSSFTKGMNATCIAPFVQVPEATAIVGCANTGAMRVETDQRFVEISGGADGTLCGRTQQGKIYCWPVATDAPCTPTTPCGAAVDVSDGRTYTAISGANRGVVGLTKDGHAYYWSTSGTSQVLPTEEIGAGHVWKQVWGGDAFWAGVDSAGTVWEGKLPPPGILDPGGEESPSPVSSQGVFTRACEGMNSGQSNGCTIAQDGHVECWGGDPQGEQGDGGDANEMHFPSAPISGGGKYKDIACGAQHICAVGVTGTLECWGWDSYGQLGPAAPATCALNELCSNVPEMVPLPQKVVSVSAGGSLTCALLADQTVWCWGANDWGQLGNGTFAGSSMPAQVLDQPPG